MRHHWASLRSLVELRWCRRSKRGRSIRRRTTIWRWLRSISLVTSNSSHDRLTTDHEVIATWSWLIVLSRWWSLVFYRWFPIVFRWRRLFNTNNRFTLLLWQVQDLYVFSWSPLHILRSKRLAHKNQHTNNENKLHSEMNPIRASSSIYWSGSYQPPLLYNPNAER